MWTLFCSQVIVDRCWGAWESKIANAYIFLNNSSWKWKFWRRCCCGIRRNRGENLDILYSTRECLCFPKGNIDRNMSARRGEIEVKRQIRKRGMWKYYNKTLFLARQILVLKEEVRMSEILLIKGPGQMKNLLWLETKGQWSLIIET